MLPDDGVPVYDPYMGAGTTGVACVMRHRRFVGVERDPHYHAVAQRRISDARPDLLGGPAITQADLSL